MDRPRLRGLPGSLRQPARERRRSRRGAAPFRCPAAAGTRVRRLLQPRLPPVPFMPFPSGGTERAGAGPGGDPPSGSPVGRNENLSAHAAAPARATGPTGPHHGYPTAGPAPLYPWCVGTSESRTRQPTQRAPRNPCPGRSGPRPTRGRRGSHTDATPRRRPAPRPFRPVPGHAGQHTPDRCVRAPAAPEGRGHEPGLAPCGRGPTVAGGRGGPDAGRGGAETDSRDHGTARRPSGRVRALRPPAIRRGSPGGSPGSGTGSPGTRRSAARWATPPTGRG